MIYKVVDSMSKLCPILTIGPTVPSFYLDKGVPNDKDNDLNLFQLDSSPINWLNSKPEGSAIYVSFGSMVCFSIEQMKEIALGLLGSGSNFLWVIPNMEKKNISKELIEEMSSSGKGLVVNWIPQLEVLSNKAIGCFLTHSGWNSTLEALCLGVPMVAIPQWTDQPLNAKYVEDVWKVGMRVKVNENGIVTKEEIESCIRKVMENDIGREMKINAKKWRELAIEAVSHGGTSDNNINEFVNELKRS
jgi:pathogen-inducible salicylic acid glucosyltransferase